MKNKKIVVLLKYYKGELNPFDGAALEVALSSGADEIIALTMAPPTALEAFRGLTRLGVKGVFVSDSVYAGSDTQATSFILAEAVRRLNPDLVFCGRQSVDGDTAQVPPMLAERLGFDIKTKVMSVDGCTFTLRSGETFTAKDKTVLTFEKIRILRFPSIFSKMGEVQTWDNTVLGLPTQKCGIAGSPTRVIKSYESSVGRRDCTFVGVQDLAELIQQGLMKQTATRQAQSNNKIKQVHYVGNLKDIAEGIAQKATPLCVEGKSAAEVAAHITQNGIKTVLWEDSDSLKVLASRVAVMVGAGLCADCISFRADGERLVMTRPALGGNITADIINQSEIAFATVRTVKNEKQQVIFAVGKGAMDDIEHVKRLALRFGAEVCCSRIVADSGKLPYEKQVGLTGRTVFPKVYVAFGISGAVQHTSAISGAGTIIAINSDKKARIFDYADYGIVAEVKNVSWS